MERTKVKSSLIANIGYDPATQTLAIEFTNHHPHAPNKVYEYAPFTPERYAKFMASESLGKHFLANIKNDATLKYKRIEEAHEEKQEAPAPEKA